jgi:hypothetical protein
MHGNVPAETPAGRQRVPRMLVHLLRRGHRRRGPAGWKSTLGIIMATLHASDEAEVRRRVESSAHDQVSAPLDIGSGRALLNLSP